MQTQFHLLLTLIVFLPAVGAIGLFLVPAKRPTWAKWGAAGISGLVFVLTLALYFGKQWGGIGTSINNLHWVDYSPWINLQLGSSFHFKVDYFLGADGLSLPMIILNGLLSFLAVIGSWHIDKRTKDYMALILLLETGVMGVFSSLDLILFFLFWEVELIPMFLLIAIWGGLRREYAAWKFLLYTLLGSSVMLAGILLLYFGHGAQTGNYTASMVTLTQDAAHQLPGNLSLGFIQISTQLLAFFLIFFGFAVKIPMFPFHTWLPDAHTEAPTAVSVLLAGVLLKMGAYGLIRICLGFLPGAAHDFAWWLGGLAAINILYGAGCSMIQSDMKKMIAYSSVSHMGYVLLGVAAAAAVIGNSALLPFQQAALTGAALQMFTHGSITGLLFFCIGVVYERAHTREIDIFGGITRRMPLLATVYTIACLASLGLPAMSGFVAEYLVFTGSFPILTTWTILGAFGIVLTAGYLLWMLKRAFYGPLNMKWASLKDATVLEMTPLVSLVFVILLIGIFPGILVNIIQPSITTLLH